MTGPVTGIRRRRGVAGRRETPYLPPDRDFYGQTLTNNLQDNGVAIHFEVLRIIPLTGGSNYFLKGNFS